MVSFDIAFDHNDAELGNYFRNSKNDLVVFIHNECPDNSINEIPSHLCNQAYIDFRIAQINENNFFFVAYSHGNHDSLVVNGNFYIKKEVNASLFCNCLFYSMSCLTANELCRDLMNNGCHAFIGFKEEAEALLGSYENLSIECDNFGLKQFIKGSSLGQAFTAMKVNFTEKVDWLTDNGEPLLAAFLASNRDALHVEGDLSLLFKDFVIN